jgi:hypothetical protein
MNATKTMPFKYLLLGLVSLTLFSTNYAMEKELPSKKPVCFSPEEHFIRTVNEKAETFLSYPNTKTLIKLKESVFGDSSSLSALTCATTFPLNLKAFEHDEQIVVHLLPTFNHLGDLLEISSENVPLKNLIAPVVSIIINASHYKIAQKNMEVIRLLHTMQGTQETRSEVTDKNPAEEPFINKMNVQVIRFLDYPTTKTLYELRKLIFEVSPALNEIQEHDMNLSHRTPETFCPSEQRIIETIPTFNYLEEMVTAENVEIPISRLVELVTFIVGQASHYKLAQKDLEVHRLLHFMQNTVEPVDREAIKSPPVFRNFAQKPSYNAYKNTSDYIERQTQEEIAEQFHRTFHDQSIAAHVQRQRPEKTPDELREQFIRSCRDDSPPCRTRPEKTPDLLAQSISNDIQRKKMLETKKQDELGEPLHQENIETQMRQDNFEKMKDYYLQKISKYKKELIDLRKTITQLEEENKEWKKLADRERTQELLMKIDMVENTNIKLKNQLSKTIERESKSKKDEVSRLSNIISTLEMTNLRLNTQLRYITEKLETKPQAQFVKVAEHTLIQKEKELSSLRAENNRLKLETTGQKITLYCTDCCLCISKQKSLLAKQKQQEIGAHSSLTLSSSLSGTRLVEQKQTPKPVVPNNPTVDPRFKELMEGADLMCPHAAQELAKKTQEKQNKKT